MASETSYDVIFAGGGTCACIAASRLAEADSSLKILILETGPHTKELPDHVQPARYFRNLIKPSETFTIHISKPSDALAGRSIVVPTGRCMGGGSSVNFVMYTRASASDYDDWETKYKNPGWGSKALIPLLRKAETWQSSEGDLSTHGTNGPIKVSYMKDQINVGTQFLDAAAGWDKDRTTTNDTNQFFNCNAYGRWPLYVSGTNGHRSDTAHRYIYDRPELKNITIETRRRVTRVIFDGDRAVGVEHVDDEQGRRNKNAGNSIVTHASRLVVLAGGAFGSPAILERSGIGSPEILKKQGITPVVDLPGVGENYMDHNVIFAPFLASEDADTLDSIFRDADDQIKPYETEWLNGGSGLLSHNAIDAGIKMRPTEKDLEELGPVFKPRWDDYFANAPDKPIMWIGPLAAYTGGDPSAVRRKYYSVGYYTEYPISTGRVHIQSSNIYDPLHFEPGYLTHEADLVILRWAYKKARELARRMASYRGEFKPGHPRFPEGSAVECKPASAPAESTDADHKYSAEDDQIIDEYHRQNVATSWHSIGTCAMKPREAGGVVDSRLNVYGVKNLKIADCSITPSNVAANTYNTAIAIGEKAAVIIAADLGIKGVTEA